MNQASVPTADEMIAEATEATGWTGGVDAGLREGLERTLLGFAEAPLTEPARADAVNAMRGDLATRFRIEQFLADHPEIEEQQIEGPLIVTSVPRSGTTATLAMLGLDPRFRYTRDWEIKQPLPPPVLGQEDSDPRAVAARKRAAAMDQSIHLHDPDGPEEDMIAIAAYDMRSYHGRYPMPDRYLDAYIEDSFSSTYRFHERVLKLLQWKRGPNRWVLKSPPHLFRFEAIVRSFHRNRTSSMQYHCIGQYNKHNERVLLCKRDKCSPFPSQSRILLLPIGTKCCSPRPGTSGIRSICVL